MRALTLFEVGNWPKIVEREVPRPGASDVVVHLKASALNRRDFYICRGLYPGVQTPVVLGSDGVGSTPTGQRVVINPGLKWRSRSEVQPADFEVLGMPHDGTFADNIVIDRQYLYSCPEYLTDSEAAALPLAGMTAFRALFTKASLQEGDKLLITGIGGGVALMAMQMAIANGNDVYVTSGSQWKIERALDMGARGAANYTDDTWSKDLASQAGQFDVIIDSAGGPGFKHLVQLAAPGARIVLYGGTRGKWQDVSPQLIFWRQIRILGTTMASAEEFRAMLDFVSDKMIRPIVFETYDLNDGAKAIESMQGANQFGKIVLRH